MDKSNPVKKILYLDHTAKLGGGEIALLNLVSGLDKTRFHPVVILASDGPLAVKLKAAGIETHVMPLDSSVVDTRKDTLGGGSVLKLRQVSSVLRYARTLAKWARSNGIALIHTNSLKSDIYGGLAGRISGIPAIWHIRDSIDSNYLPAPAVAVFRAAARILPQELVGNSESTLRCLEPRTGRGAVVYSGVLPNEIVPADPSSTPKDSGKDSQIVSLVGRIAEWKGQHILIEAAPAILARFPKTKFRIIGAPLFGDKEQQYEQGLKDTVKRLGIEQSVDFMGFRNDVTALLSETDILLHASILGEPFGQVVVQGMAAGKPVVATNGGALPEIVVPGKTGILVPMGDSGAMAEAVIAILADPVKARAMGDAGRERVKERFTIKHSVATVESVYDNMLRRRTGAASGGAGAHRAQEEVVGSA